MAQPPPERAIGGNKPRGCSTDPRGREDHPLTDGHLLALLGEADPALRDAIAVLALSGMRLAELRRLRVGQCGREAFRVAACAANGGPRAVPVHTALTETVARLTSGRAKDALLIAESAASEPSRPALERRFDGLWAAAAGWPSPGIGALRLWFVGAALEAGQPPDAIAAVVGLFRPGEGARP